ncbi:hypothetical protein GCM10009630_47210 [Kribbella jejuensis]|uniref:Uncharacterized protein DUF2752 n=1 Tax=Kribbella jejuensis TaxID=236068 RepID=A0A542E741_9ACTN|nr:DUF2752 domain-containing protein [Kribbella jejuensis]TQJ11109.1 uncharacterized protein DUF2752 [Kribbella jejuensis]
MSVSQSVVLRPTGPVQPLDRRVWGLTAVGIGGFALAGAYQLSGGRIGLPCILHATTGLNCPLCGSTRMAAAMLRGDFGGAWHFNPVVFVLGPLAAVALGYQVLAWALESLRLVRLPRLQLSRRTVDRLTNAIVALFIVYGVARNLF